MSTVVSGTHSKMPHFGYVVNKYFCGVRHERNETHECCLQKRIQSATGLIWTTFETILISGGRAAGRYHSQLGLWHHRYDCGACVLLPTCNTALYERHYTYNVPHVMPSE